MNQNKSEQKFVMINNNNNNNKIDVQASSVPQLFIAVDFGKVSSMNFQHRFLFYL